MAIFRVCNYVVPSPSLLQSVPSSGTSMQEQYIVLPPHYVGIEVLSGNISEPYHISNLTMETVVFIDVVQEDACLANSSTCPDWGNLEMPNLILLLPSGTFLAGDDGLWLGKVVWPPGRIVTQGNLSDPFLVRSMGIDNIYDFCLAGQLVVVICWPTISMQCTCDG